MQAGASEEQGGKAGLRSGRCCRGAVSTCAFLSPERPPPTSPLVMAARPPPGARDLQGRPPPSQSQQVALPGDPLTGGTLSIGRLLPHLLRPPAPPQPRQGLERPHAQPGATGRPQVRSKQVGTPEAVGHRQLGGATHRTARPSSPPVRPHSTLPSGILATHLQKRKPRPREATEAVPPSTGRSRGRSTQGALRGAPLPRSPVGLAA